MFDMPGQYRATVFVNASNIVPSTDTVAALLELFRDRGFLPTIFHEISPPNPERQTRLRLNSQNNEWGINLASERIDIEKNPLTPAGKNLGDIESFCAEATEFFDRLLKHFKKKGHRLALVSSGLCREMDERQLQTIFQKLFRPLEFYEKYQPFEWRSRFAARSGLEIAKCQETMNINTSINRLRGELSQPTKTDKFDRIEIMFDINTGSESDENRFSADSFGEFYRAALAAREQLLEQLRRTIDG